MADEVAAKGRADDDRMRVAAVVCTYRPDAAVSGLITALEQMTSDVIVIDDGSERAPEFGDGVEVVHFDENRGLAAALNEGLARARQRGCTHVVTFDQDTLVEPHYVTELQRFWVSGRHDGLRLGALGALNVTDITYRGTTVGSFTVLPEVIQSGTMFDLVALQQVGDFDAGLVIDGVDSDGCLRLRQGGWVVAVAPLSIDHQVGSSRVISVMGRQILLTRHQPFRDYYMVRNRLLLIGRNWHSEPRWSMSMLRRTIVAAIITVVLDNHRGAKVAAISRGVLDGLRGRRGRLDPSVRRRWSTEDPANPLSIPTQHPVDKRRH